MRSIIIIAAAICCTASGAFGQTTTNCFLNDQWVTCNTVGASSGGVTIPPGWSQIPSQVLTPFQMQQQLAQVQEAQARAREAQTEAQAAAVAESEEEAQAEERQNALDAQIRAQAADKACKAIMVDGVPYTHCE